VMSGAAALFGLKRNHRPGGSVPSEALTLTPETLMASSTEAVSTSAIADHPVRAALLLGALGVVFGDIGTSPIYAFRESLKAAGGASEAAVFGVLSFVVWAWRSSMWSS
jgi:K+ potassium transporter